MKIQLPTPSQMVGKRKIVNLSLPKIFLLSIVFLFGQNIFAQTGTWSIVSTNAPHANMGVMLLLTDGTVLCHNSSGGGVGKGWDKLTPDATGSYINGTWSTMASNVNDRLYFPSQVLPNGKVFVAGGEYGAGATHGEVYDPVANTWTATGAVPSNQNIYDGNSQILANGKVLVGIQNGLNPSFNNAIYDPATNTWVAAPNSPLNHDEAAWLKLPDGSILFVGISSSNSCRYIPATNSWVADAVVPTNLYDPYGQEAGAALMLPNGKAIFFGATGHNAIYTPSGTTAPGSWVTAASFPITLGRQVGTVDAPAAIMPNGKILCSASPINTSSSNQFLTPVYFYEYDYLTNTFAQVTSVLPTLGSDSLAGINCDFTTFLLLPTGQVLMGMNQTGISLKYFVYTQNGSNIAGGKPTLNSVYQTACGNTFYFTGKLFNGISEGAAYGDDWEMSTNYPLIRLTNGPNVYYAKTTNWNRIGAVRTDSLADTAQFTLPGSLPAGTYTIQVVVNGFPSNPRTFNTYRVTTSVIANANCNGNSNGSAQATVLGGNGPYTYLWAPSGGTNATATNLAAGTYTVTVVDNLGCITTATVTITQPPVLTASTGSIVNVLCHGASTGSATATAGGGTPGYTYAWAPSGGTNAIASNLTAGTYTVTVTDTHGCTITTTATITQPTTLTATTTHVNVNCNGGNGGSATVTAGGGTPAYSYAWAPSGGTGTIASNLIAGTYTVTVTDNHGCTATATAIITQPTLLTATTTVVNINCNGGTGSATAIPTGGTPNYSYAWAPSGGTTSTASNLSPGTYTVTITDSHGCTTTATATITQPTLLTTSTTVVNVNCNGGTGSATAIPSGGTPNYSYAWAPSGGTAATANNLVAGTYTVTVTDNNGCTTTATAIITEPSAIIVSATAVTSTVCAGVCTDLNETTGGGTSPYTYLWSTGATTTTVNVCPTITTTYTITSTDGNGCTQNATVTVNVNALPVVTLTSANDTTCINWTTDALTGNPTGGTFSGTGVTGTNFDPSAAGAGTYNIVYTYTDVNGCTNTDSSHIVVNLCTGIDGLATINSSLHVYPNPFGDHLTLQIDNLNGAAVAELFNVLGEKIYVKEITGTITEIDLRKLESGIYFIKITMTDGSVTKKIVKE